MNQSINTDSKNSKEPQQKYRLGTVSIKILGGLNRFYRRLTSSAWRPCQPCRPCQPVDLADLSTLSTCRPCQPVDPVNFISLKTLLKCVCFYFNCQNRITYYLKKHPHGTILVLYWTCPQKMYCFFFESVYSRLKSNEQGPLRLNCTSCHRHKTGKEYKQLRRHKVKQHEWKAKRTALSKQMNPRLSKTK